MVTSEQTDKLLNGEIDLGLARPPFDRTAFASRLIHREELLLAVPAGHQLTKLDRPVEPHELSAEPLIMYSPIKARYFYDLVVRVVSVASENVVHTVSQVLTMLCLVAGGRGVAFVPATSTRLGIPGIEFLTLAGLPPEPVELHLLWWRENRNPAASSVVDCVARSAPVC
jgi:DNA-binding transcriptional LysR family regulator